MKRLFQPEYGVVSIQGNKSTFLVFNLDLLILYDSTSRRYMKPLLTHSRPTLLETLPVCLSPLARLLTTTEQLTQVCIDGTKRNTRILIQFYRSSFIFKEGPTRRADSDSDLCIDDDDRTSRGDGSIRRNSINRVSIRLVSDDRTIFASYKNRDQDIYGIQRGKNAPLTTITLESNIVHVLWTSLHIGLI